MVVDAVADHNALLLVVVEPLLDRCEVVLGRSRTFQLGMHHLLHPVGIDRTNRAVNTDDGVEWDFGFRRRGFPFHDNEFACQKAWYGGFTANLVENRLDLTEVHVAVLDGHLVLLSDYLSASFPLPEVVGAYGRFAIAGRSPK